MQILRLLLLTGPLLISINCTPNDSHAQMKVIKINGDLAQDTAHARTLNQQAADAIARSDFNGAEKLLKQAIVADSQFGPAQNNLGVVYFNQSKPYQAAQQFLLAAALLPHDPEPRNALGLVFESSGRFDDAITYYGRASMLDPNNLEYIGNNARARVRRGDHTVELRTMLTNLATNDSRAQWNLWARETLVHLNHNSAADIGRPVTTGPAN